MGLSRCRTSTLPRQLRFEFLEDRRMLSTMADIVFLVDESGNFGETDYQDWLLAMVSGINGLDATLRNTNGIDARYGLVGFGEGILQSGHTVFGHSQVVNTSVSTTDPAALFGTATQLQLAIDQLAMTGGSEDGWDALEHAIAEYPFREGAVPVFVLVQGQEGRVLLNNTLKRDGIFAALTSKNVVLNSMVVGPINVPLFSLAPYELASGDFDNRRVLGVEADQADAKVDGQHDYHLINETTGVTIMTKPQTQVDALQVSYNASNTGATGLVGSGKSVLLGRNISGGIGGSATSDYRAKSVLIGGPALDG